MFSPHSYILDTKKYREVPKCVEREWGRFGNLSFCSRKWRPTYYPKSHSRGKMFKIQSMFTCGVLNDNSSNGWFLQYSWGITLNQSKRTEASHMRIRKRNQAVSQFGRVKWTQSQTTNVVSNQAFPGKNEIQMD